MLDSNIVYKVTAVGVEEATAKFNSLGATIQKMNFNANGTVTASGKLTSTLDAQNKATGGVAAATDRASKSQRNYIGHILRTTVLSAAVNKLFLELVDVSGQAIKQVDLMNNFPATMASMGESTADASEAMQALRTYVGQVGGNLGDATSLVTRFVGATQDVKAATAIFVGLNNALIAGDSSMEEQRLAAIQFAQALERGRPDMREWRSLVQNMSFQLAQVAEEMGHVNANALGEALTSGEESMASFVTTLTKLSTGTGAIAVQARARMDGMQFSFNVLKNTMVQGLAAIIQAFGRENIVSFFTFLTQVIRVLTGWVVTLINLLGSLVNMISRLFGGGNIFKSIAGDAKGVADSLGSGAGGAEDLADGLDDAGKSAKKLNKQLASFDKMNVLTGPDTGGGEDDSEPSGPGFDTGQIGELGNLFGDIGGDLKDASKWAKIFAGVLGALAANKLIEKIFGINPLKAFGKAVWKNAILPLSTSLVTAAKTAAKTVGTFGTAIGRGLLGKGSGGSGILGRAAALGARIGLAVRAGFIAVFSGIGTVLRTVLISPLAGIGRVIFATTVAVIGGVAAALGVSFAAAVAIVAAAVAAIIAIIWLVWTNWDTIWSFITIAFSTFWQWMTSLWNTLYDIFAGPIKWLLQFVRGIFIVIVAIIATALELIFKLFVGMVKLIFVLLATIAGWVYNNVISPVFNFFVALWDGVINAVTTAWNWIFEKVLRPIGTWINRNVIQPVSNFFRGLWDRVSGFVRGFVTSLRGFLNPVTTWIKINIIDRISRFFSGLWNGIKNGLSGMINGLRNIFRGVSNIFKTPLNGIIDLLNRAIRGVNRLKVPDWVPGLGGRSPGIPELPKLARGGIVEQATATVLGENGAEAVVPLENNTEWIDRLASRINSGGQSNTNPDIIPVTNLEPSPANHIEINVSGVFATSSQEQKKVAELIAKHLDGAMRSKGLKVAH